MKMENKINYICVALICFIPKNAPGTESVNILIATFIAVIYFYFTSI